MVDFIKHLFISLKFNTSHHAQRHGGSTTGLTSKQTPQHDKKADL